MGSENLTESGAGVTISGGGMRMATVEEFSYSLGYVMGMIENGIVVEIESEHDKAISVSFMKVGTVYHIEYANERDVSMTTITLTLSVAVVERTLIECLSDW